MLKKLDEANKNIELLIGELIDAREDALGKYCPYDGNGNPEKDCEHITCSDCKGKYFENMRERLLDEYIVK